MATIRERRQADGTRKFHVQIRMTGFPSRTASFPTRREAERWARTIEGQMIEGRHFRTAEARRRTVADAIDRYVLEELPKKRNGGMHRFTLPWWRDRIGNLKLADVTPAVLVEHRGKLGRETFIRAKPESKRTTVKGEPRRFKRSNSTVNRYLASLSHVFTVARKEWHWVGHNPFDDLSKLRENPGRTRYLTSDERARLLRETAKNPTLHVFVVLALATAARAGELLNLHWRDVDLDAAAAAPEGSEGSQEAAPRAARLIFRLTKNAQPRATWVHGEPLRLLEAHAARRDGDSPAVFPSTTGKGTWDYKLPFGTAVEAAGIADFRFHDLRHSAATYLAMQGASEQQLRAIGGWKSGVVSRYVHIASTDSQAVLRSMTKKILGE